MDEEEIAQRLADRREDEEVLADTADFRARRLVEADAVLAVLDDIDWTGADSPKADAPSAPVERTMGEENIDAIEALLVDFDGGADDDEVDVLELALRESERREAGTRAATPDAMRATRQRWKEHDERWKDILRSAADRIRALKQVARTTRQQLHREAYIAGKFGGDPARAAALEQEIGTEAFNQRADWWRWQRMARGKAVEPVQTPEVDYAAIDRQLAYERPRLTAWAAGRTQWRNRIEELVAHRKVMLIGRARLGRDLTAGEFAKAMDEALPGKRHHKGSIHRGAGGTLLQLEKDGILREPEDGYPEPELRVYNEGSF